MQEKAFTKQELVLIRRLNTPHKLQEFINTLKYNTGRRISAADVLRVRKADCLEAAVFASVVLSFHGIENFLIDLSAVRDEDHALCIFKQNNLYGAIAQSKFLNLRYRHPVYKNLRELTMSYFEHYFSFQGILSMKSHSKPIKLNMKDNRWIFKKQAIYKIEKQLDRAKHIQLVKGNFPLVSKEKFKREIIILPKGAKVGKRYR